MPTASLREYRASAQYSEICGHRIAHWHAGSGKDVLFIHGFPSASWDWHHQWRALVSEYRLHALDLLGFGLSDKPRPYSYSLAEQANLVLAMLNQHQLERVDIVAHDYGVSVAQELLSRQQQGKLDIKIASICFLNGGLFAESHRPLATQKLLHGPLGGLVARFLGKGALKRSFTRIFGSNSPPTDQEIDVIWTLLREQRGHLALPLLLDYLDERAMHRDRWIQAMQQTDIPLGFINGVQDPISGRHMLEQFDALIPQGSSLALDVGHYPQIEAPGEVTEAIRVWLVDRHL